jgi:hypothetical protein
MPSASSAATASDPLADEGVGKLLGDGPELRPMAPERFEAFVRDKTGSGVATADPPA